MVLALVLQLGLGAVPLWALASLQPARLVLGARLHMEPRLGDVAFQRPVLRLGTAAAGLQLRARHRVHMGRHTRRVQLRVWTGSWLVHLLRLCAFAPSPTAPPPGAGQPCSDRSQRNDGREQLRHREQHHDRQRRYSPGRDCREDTRTGAENAHPRTGPRDRKHRPSRAN